MAAGAACLGGSVVWLGLVLDRLAYGWMVGPYVLAGIGLALVMTPASTDAMNTAPSALRGEASGVMQTMRQVGGTVGLAIMATVVATVESNRLTDLAVRSGSTPSQRQAFQEALDRAHGNPSALEGVPAATVHAAENALIAGIRASFLVAGGAVLLGAVLAALLLRRVAASDAAPAPVAVPRTLGAHPALGVAGRPDAES